MLTGETFQLEATRTWEFNTSMPIRSYAIPFLYLKIPMSVFKALSMLSKQLFNFDLLSSYSLLVFTRAVMCAISFVNDFCVYEISSSHNLKYDIRLLALASSCVMLTFGIRSFSNTIEMALCSVVIYLVSECMIVSNTVIYQQEYLDEKYDKAKKIRDRVRYFKMRMSLPKHTYNKCAIISTLCVIGIFNRPTFILFGLPAIFHWMARGLGSRSVSFIDFNLRMLFFILSGLPAFVIIIIIDSLYYGYLTLAQIYIMDVSMENFLVTPVNFFRYNINPENTASHGHHPNYLHFVGNIPMLFNILGILAIGSFGKMCYDFAMSKFNKLPQTQSFVSLMMSAVFVPVVFLSYFNHQEPRFLIPITLPMIMLQAPKLITGININSHLRESQWRVIKYVGNRFDWSISGRFVLKVWFMINLIFSIFFGFIHQAGVVQLADHFSKHHQMLPTSTHVHLITSHVYNIPESLLILPHSSMLYTNHKSGQKYKIARRFFIHEYGSLSLNETFKKMKRILDVSEVRARVKKINYEIFVALPSSKAFELNQIFHQHESILTFKEERVFYPHLSVEAFPDFHHLIHPCEINGTDADETDGTCEIGAIDDDWLSISSFTRKLTSIGQQFGLVVYKVEVKRRHEGEGEV